MSMSPDLEMQPINSDDLSSAHESEAPNPGLPHPEVNNSEAEHEIRGQVEGSEEPFPPTQNIPGSQRRGAPSKKLFGIKKTKARTAPRLATHDPVAAAYDYTVKYKDDAFGHELDDNARVWHVYNDEAKEFDADMIEEASDSLDILLVFAGLFSAVLTTFLVQTSQALSTDNAAITVSLLKELIDLQRAQANGLPLTSVESATVTSSPSAIDKWVNGLWFTSLSLSLSDALLAVLAKQWLRQYHTRLSGNPKQRAILRQFRYDGFERWGVRSIIGFLPMILHISLIFFLIGLVLLLIPLDTAMAAVTGAIMITLLVTYLLTNLLPLALIQCPYRTPLTYLIWRLYVGVIAHLYPFLSWAPQKIRLYLHRIANRRRKGFNDWEAAVASSWGSHSGTAETLLSLWGTTANQSARLILANSLPVLSDYPHDLLMSAGYTHRWAIERALLHCVNTHNNTLRRLPESMVLSLEEITETEKANMRRALLSGLILRREGSAWGYRRLFSDIYGVLSDCQVLVSDLDLILMILALDECDSIRFSIIGDECSPISPVDLQGKDALSWIMQCHPNVDTLNLPLLAWQLLSRKGEWNVSHFEQSGISQGRGLADEYVVLRKGPAGCRFISLSEFLRLQSIPGGELQHFEPSWRFEEPNL